MVQTYLLSPNYTAQKVRVIWTRENKTQVLLYVNELTYFGTRKGTLTRGRTGSCVGYRGAMKDASLLFVSPFAEPSNCSLSTTTQTLSRTVEYIKQLLESTVLRAVRGLVKGLQIDMLLDMSGKWYFLGIEEYQVELGQGRSLPASPERSLAVIQASAPTTRVLSPVPDIRISKVSPVAREETHSEPNHSTPMRRPRLKAALLPRSLTLSRKQSPETTNTSFTYILSKNSISSPKELAQVREMEKDIAGLIGQNAALTHMTYRSWQKHVKEGNHRAYSLDQLYAKSLCKVEKQTRNLAQDSQRDLKGLRTKMIETMAAASLKPNTLLSYAGNLLLGRASDKKTSVNTADLHKLKQKLELRQKEEMNKTAGVRIARDLVTYAARHIDALKASARLRKKEFQQRNSSG